MVRQINARAFRSTNLVVFAFFARLCVYFMLTSHKSKLSHKCFNKYYFLGKENRQILYFILYSVYGRSMESIIVNYTCYEHTSLVREHFICMHIRWCAPNSDVRTYHSSMANVCAPNHALHIWIGKKSTVFCTFSFSFEIYIWATFDEKKHKTNNELCEQL